MSVFSVLIVDDEVDYLDIMIKRMKKRNLQVAGVKSGKEALEFLKKEPVDVVLLDVKMPEMDGLQVLREVKREYPLIEVIMLTGHANVEVAIEGMELGAFDYLIKPMDIDDLLYKLQDAYKRRSIQLEKIRNFEKRSTQDPGGADKPG